MKKNTLVKKIAFYVVLVILWQIISMLNIWPDNIFPSPYEVAEDLVYMASDGSLFFGIGITILRLIVGLAIAIAGGIILGVLMARIETVNQTNIKTTVQPHGMNILQRIKKITQLLSPSWNLQHRRMTRCINSIRRSSVCNTSRAMD